MSDTAIVWFRRDLRLADNPALDAALTQCRRVLPLYIHAPGEDTPWEPGAASHWWLHHSLSALQRRVADCGSGLLLRSGPSLAALRRLAAETGASHIFWNRRYEPAALERDRTVQQALEEDGRVCRIFNGSLLNEPWETKTRSGGPFRVFTPFYRANLRAAQSAAPLPAPTRLPALGAGLKTKAVDDLDLLPRVPWHRGLAEAWEPGEAGAARLLAAFAESRLARYGERRDLPAAEGTSRLSPHLHFGELSPRQILWQCHAQASNCGLESFERELYWREFAHHLMFHFPATPQQPLDTRFTAFPWRSGDAELRAWQRGETGFPIIDAGMRELWHTGWMHNRVRMLVASFLTKNLLVSWQEGARWFWDTLVDADLANNTQGWQWTAGCGADAAPYFRIFNPVSQSQRFDPQGAYLRRWLPALRPLPVRWLHQPWAAPATELRSLGIKLGEDYPRPMIDLKVTRRRALDAWAELRRDPPRPGRQVTMDSREP